MLLHGWLCLQDHRTFETVLAEGANFRVETS